MKLIIPSTGIKVVVPVMHLLLLKVRLVMGQLRVSTVPVVEVTKPLIWMLELTPS